MQAGLCGCGVSSLSMDPLLRCLAGQTNRRAQNAGRRLVRLQGYGRDAQAVRRSARRDVVPPLRTCGPQWRNIPPCLPVLPGSSRWLYAGVSAIRQRGFRSRSRLQSVSFCIGKRYHSMNGFVYIWNIVRRVRAHVRRRLRHSFYRKGV